MLKEFKVTLYTTQDCSKCKLLKMLLATKHVDFRDLDAIANRESIKDCWFISAPIIRVEIEGQDDIFFWDMEKFINYLDDNAIGV
jgi:glutaredoxin